MTSAPASPHFRPRRPRLAVIGWLMLLLTVVCAALAPAALAHNALVSSNPVADSVVPTAPTSIELVFDQDVKDFQPKIAITITGHDPVEIVPTVNGPTVTADLTSVDLPGPDSTDPVSWRVGYRIVSADGHPVTGLLDFSVGSGRPRSPRSRPPRQPEVRPRPSRFPSPTRPTAAPASLRTNHPQPVGGGSAVPSSSQRRSPESS